MEKADNNRYYFTGDFYIANVDTFGIGNYRYTGKIKDKGLIKYDTKNGFKHMDNKCKQLTGVIRYTHQEGNYLNESN